MIDRAVKRLVQIKVIKQMLGQTGTERTDNRSGKLSITHNFGSDSGSQRDVGQAR